MQNQGGFGELRTKITSFDLSTGAINWNYTGNFIFPSQPGVGGGFVTFVGSTSSSSSLYVLDAVTGTLRYTVPIPEGPDSMMPTVVQDPVSGNVTAFVANGSNVSALSLGRVSGSVLWTRTGEFGGFSIPTVVGTSIVLAGPDQYYAFDQATGAENQFWSGNTEGGGGTTVAYDAARRQFYVAEAYNGFTTLSAYHYFGNAHITLLWQRTGDGVSGGGSVAIGPTGKVYSAGTSVIWELDPATGITLRSIVGSFATKATPALTNNVLWIMGESQVFAYDLVTLQLLRAFNGSRGDFNTAYDSPGAFADGYFVLDYGNLIPSPGFDVYSGPLPLPAATTNPATNVANFSATLNGTVNPNELSTAVHFDYGTTTNYGSSTATQNYSGYTVQNVVANLSNLRAGATYHFRIVASNAAGTSYGTDRTFTTPAVRAVVADFNGDGTPDLVIQRASSHQTAVLYLNNNVVIGGALGPTLPAGWSLAGAADFYGNGHTDFALFNSATGQTVIVYLSGLTVVGAAVGPSLSPGWELVATADFNGDGHPDYVLYKASTGETAIWYLNKNVFLSAIPGPTLPSGWNLIAVADFNGDGHPDYALFNSVTGQTVMVNLSGGTVVGAAFGPTVPGAWPLVATTDFSQDGHPDYLMFNPVTRQTAIAYLNNNVLVNAASGPTLPAGWTLIAP